MVALEISHLEVWGFFFLLQSFANTAIFTSFQVFGLEIKSLTQMLLVRKSVWSQALRVNCFTCIFRGPATSLSDHL